MAAGYPPGGALESDPMEVQGDPRLQRLLVGHDAIFYFKYDMGRSVSHPLSSFNGPNLFVYSVGECLHVHIWRGQEFLAVQIRSGKVLNVRDRGRLYDSGEHCYRKCGRCVGHLREETQILCRTKGFEPKTVHDKCVMIE